MLEQPVESEASGAQRRGRVAIEGKREGKSNWSLSVVALARVAREGAPAERGSFANLIRVRGAVTLREQSAVKRVGTEAEKPGLVYQAADLDELAGEHLALGIPELGLLFGKAGLLLFMCAQQSFE